MPKKITNKVEFLQAEIARRDRIIESLKAENLVLTRVALRHAQSRVEEESR